ncbi:MAG: hypothetical protein QOG03_480 [Actinomycetota bacterium]|jgi:hypothetical protein|nr:hypothetical protein [Actinomycetota bacterium]
MADLSKVLGDVYATADGPEARRFVSAAREQAPEWADESRLDAAFADWTPGPPSDAPAAERALFASPAPKAETELHGGPGPLALDDDLAAALSEALAEAPPLVDNELFDQDIDAAPSVDFEVEAVVRQVIDPEPAGEPVAEVAEPTLTPAESHALLVSAAPEVADDHTATTDDSVPSTARLSWNRSDDDLLPRGARRRGLSFSLRRR